jgi:hypothetical protein
MALLNRMMSLSQWQQPCCPAASAKAPFIPMAWRAACSILRLA